MQGRDFWGIPPLLTGGWDRKVGGRTTWVTPLFHSTTDVKGDLESLHVGPYFEGRNYWAFPPLLSWHVNWPDESETTWLTPAFHLSADAKGWTSGPSPPGILLRARRVLGSRRLCSPAAGRRRTGRRRRG
jgi:hypothetical protein